MSVFILIDFLYFFNNPLPQSSLSRYYLFFFYVKKGTQKNHKGGKPFGLNFPPFNPPFRWPLTFSKSKQKSAFVRWVLVGGLPPIE